MSINSMLVGSGSSSNSLGGIVSSAKDMIGAVTDSQASSGKSIQQSVTTSTAAGTVLASFKLPEISLLGRYSIILRIKSNYKSLLTLGLLTVNIKKGNDTIKTLSIRECDFYDTSNYCTFTTVVDINTPGDDYTVQFAASGSSKAATFNFDYVYAELAGASLLAI